MYSNKMGHCRFVKWLGGQIRGRPGGSVLSWWEGGLTWCRIDAFTFIELIIIVTIIGILCGIAAPIYADFKYRAQIVTATAIIREVEAGINIYKYRSGTYPLTLSDAMIATPLDPWGNPYQYLSSRDPAWQANQRLDRHMRPLNSDFDLYSKGADGRSAPALTHPLSRDDVVRAGNGSFVGLGADF